MLKMNDPALKGEVSPLRKMRQSNLRRKIPAVMAVIDVVSNRLSSYIANTAKEFTRAPKMSLAKVPSQPGMLAKKLVRAPTLKQLKSFGDAQRRRKPSKQVNMVRLYLKFVDFNRMLRSNFTKKLLAMFPNNGKFKRVLCVLRLPDKVEGVLANAVASFRKSFHFGFLRAFFAELTLKNVRPLQTPAPLRAQYVDSNLEKAIGGLGSPRAKALGILCLQ